MKSDEYNPKNNEGYVVRLSENALLSLVLNGLEAYAVFDMNKKSGPKRGLETYGSLIGYETKMKDERTLFQIELANVDTSAKRNKDSVKNNEDATRLKSDTLKSFWPHLEYLGDFHTHPYKCYTDVDDIEGYYLSEDDRKDLAENSSSWDGYGYRAGLVVAIGELKIAGSKNRDWVGSECTCVQMTLGNLRLWITAYCAFLDDKKKKLVYTDDNDPLVFLDCPSITGFAGEYIEYGRFGKRGKDGFYCSGKEPK